MEAKVGDIIVNHKGEVGVVVALHYSRPIAEVDMLRVPIVEWVWTGKRETMYSFFKCVDDEVILRLLERLGETNER